MKTIRNLKWTAMVVMAMIAWASVAHAAIVVPVTGWAVHNGTSTVTNGGTNSPTFTAADNITAMGVFAPIELLKTGHSIKVTTTLNLGARTGGVGVNTLNTQLRIGLFDGPGAGGAVVANDIPNTGYIIEYSNLAAGGLIRRQDSITQIAPFNGPINVGNGTQDTGVDSLQGANVGPVVFELMLTRNGSLIDLTGKISGTDSVTTNPYSSNFTASGLALAPNGFVFDRVGVLLGDNVNAANATLNNTSITAVIPEPGSFIVFAIVTLAGGAGWWRKRQPGQAAQ